MSDPGWLEAKEVLCIRLDGAGDLVMTGPALGALRQARPDRRLTVLTSPAGAAVAELIPWVDSVIEYAAPWMKATPDRHDGRGDELLVAELRRRSFDAAAIFTVWSQSPLPAALTCRLAGIPLRVAHCRENPYQLLSDWLPEPEPEELVRHEVRRQLDLVAAVGARPGDERMAIEVPERARARVAEALDELGVGPSWVVVHPGASAPSRRYPPESWARACRSLVRKHHVEVVFSGAASEVGLVGSIRSAMGAPSHSLAGELDVPDLAALLEAAPLLVAANTGPVHIAAAVGTPVVDVYAQTNPQHTPWGVPNRVLFNDVSCRWCYKSVCPEGHHLCLRGVAPQSVTQAALGLLQAAGRVTPQAP